MLRIQRFSHVLSTLNRISASCFLKHRQEKFARQCYSCNVLAVLPAWKDKFNAKLEDIDPALKEQFKIYGAVTPLITKNTTQQQLDLDKYTKQCEEIITTKDISIILSFRDVSSLVSAALIDKFPHIKGAHLEPTFLSYNKYLTRKYLDPDPDPIKYAYLDVENICIEKLDKILDYLGRPAFIKPTTGTASFGVAKVMTTSDILKQLDIYKQAQDVKLQTFLNNRLDYVKYPEALQNGAIIEEFISPVATVGIDGCILNGDILQWPIHDIVYWQSKPHCIKGFVLPSNLDENILQKVKTHYKNVASRMMKYGYNNSFLAVEFFILADGSCKLMEINARMFSPLLQIYRQCLQNGDPVEALLNMGSNMPVKPPQFKGSYGMNSMITTYTSGRADELLDYNEVNQVKEIRPLYASTDNVPLPNGDQGTMLAIADITAKSYQGVLDKYEEICGRVLKMPQWSPSF